MILVDANLLLYAYDASSPHHDKASAWLERALAADERLGFPLTTLLAFVRIATDPRASRKPLPPTDAISIVESLLEHPNASFVQPTDRHWEALDKLARAGKVRGPQIMDAHIAALTMEHGARLCTTDRDFARFPRVRTIDPTAD